ncbi:MAG: DUF4230 domain-containing protein [Herpetosiphonaceae bacterium]|nr:DUF4230 domain-containing protein [Herpetosiphonaceae bacterium]
MHRERQPRSIRSLLMFGLSFVLVALVLWSVFSPSKGGGSALLPQPTATFRPGPTVIQAIQRKAKLETVAMTISGDTTVTKEHGIFGVCSESLTYLAYYEVSAGIDLSRISESNLQVSDDGYPDNASVVVTLPPPEILHNELDTANSRIVSQDTTKWVPGCSHEIATMTVEAQQQLHQYAASAAREKGILRMAETNAGEELQRLLGDVGYRNVTIRYASQGDPLPPSYLDPTPVPTVSN